MPSLAEQECTQAMRASSNIQPRKNLPPLVPEFKQVTHQDSESPLPAHARPLSTPKQGYIAGAKKVQDRQVQDHQITVGAHFSPEEFLIEAVRLCHPTEHTALFPKEVRSNVSHLASRTVRQLAQERTEEVKRRVALSIDLAEKEKAVKASLSFRIAEVFKDKRLCLLKQATKI